MRVHDFLNKISEFRRPSQRPVDDHQQNVRHQNMIQIYKLAKASNIFKIHQFL